MELGEQVSLALLVVLETLSPVERAVFVLREVFGMPVAEVAAVLDRSEAAVRQLAHRAREHVEARRPRFDADRRAQREVTERFLAAAVGGDVQSLLAALVARRRPRLRRRREGHGRAPPDRGGRQGRPLPRRGRPAGNRAARPARRGDRRQRRPRGGGLDRRRARSWPCSSSSSTGWSTGSSTSPTRTSWPGSRHAAGAAHRLRRVSSPFGPPPAPAEFVERALCVLAHPDDVDFGAGGTVATWTEAGIEVTYCIVTDGDAGGFDDDGPARPRWARMRQAEQRAAAKAVGVDGRPLPRLPRRPARADPRPAPRHQPGDPAGAAAAACCTSPRSGLRADRRQPPRPHGRRASRPCARSTPTPATRSPSPSCSATRAWRRGRWPRCGCGASPRADHARRRHRCLRAQVGGAAARTSARSGTGRRG